MALTRPFFDILRREWGPGKAGNELATKEHKEHNPENFRGCVLCVPLRQKFKSVASVPSVVHSQAPPKAKSHYVRRMAIERLGRRNSMANSPSTPASSAAFRNSLAPKVNSTL
jgi:hypothetical protein